MLGSEPGYVLGFELGFEIGHKLGYNLGSKLYCDLGSELGSELSSKLDSTLNSILSTILGECGDWIIGILEGLFDRCELISLAYYHGGASLAGLIINRVQDFVGSNNANLLTPADKFGTKRMGDKDAARYTQL